MSEMNSLAIKRPDVVTSSKQLRLDFKLRQIQHILPYLVRAWRSFAVAVELLRRAVRVEVEK
jgi:hypothetical protein